MTASTPPDQPAAEETKSGRSPVFYVMLAVGGFIALSLLILILALALALFADLDRSAYWVGIIRDVFIIFLALEGMVMGAALIVLVLQVAALLNLVQQEIPPIVDNAHETVTTVRGTAQFISSSVIGPIITLGAATAGLGALLRELSGIRRNVRKADQARQTKQAQSPSTDSAGAPKA